MTYSVRGSSVSVVVSPQNTEAGTLPPHSSSRGTFCHPFPMVSNLCPRQLPRGHGGYIQKEETKTRNYIWEPQHHNGKQEAPSNDQINGFSDSITPQLDTSTGVPPPARGCVGIPAPASFSKCIAASCQPRGEPEGEPSPTPCAGKSAGSSTGAGSILPEKSRALQEMWCPQQFWEGAHGGCDFPSSWSAHSVEMRGSGLRSPVGKLPQEQAQTLGLAQHLEMATQTQDRIPRAGSSQVWYSPV